MISKAIKKIDEHIEEEDTEEIILDEIEIVEISPELKKKLESLQDVSILSMNDCQLKSLANFPNLPNLVRVELMNNSFPAEELKHLAGLKELQSLSISDNDIKTVDDLKVLAGLPLAQLDVSGTELAKQADYRDRLFEMFKQLDILDNKDKEGNEVDYDEEEFDDEEFDDEEGDEFDDDEEDDMDDDEEEDDEDDDQENGHKRTKN